MQARGLLSVGQAAEQLEVSPSTVRNWVEKGYIRAFRLPSGVRRIPRTEITRLANEYFTFAAPVEGEDEGTLVLAPEEESGQWGTLLGDLDLTGSSGQPSSAETDPDQSIDP